MVWGCMLWNEVGYTCKIDGKMDVDLYVSILDDDIQASLYFYGKTATSIIFQQDNDLKHTNRKAKSWFQDHDFEVFYGLLNHQTLIQMNTFEIIWRGNWQSMKGHLMEYWNFGRGYKLNGIR